MYFYASTSIVIILNFIFVYGILNYDGECLLVVTNLSINFFIIQFASTSEY